jgi:O-acetyl-ADP-ribose deacetylase (regulator of RNase III)
MSYEIRPLDITKVKCDAIVNSLGVRESVKVYGSICRSIVNAAHSSELKAEIDSHSEDANPGKIYITKGYNLPAKNIIHIVTPYFSKDDQMFALEFVYKLALMTAYKKSWKHIAIPIIGTGANGYPHAYVLKMLTALVEAFSDTYPSMKVTVCMPVISPEDYEQKFDEKELDKSIKEYFKNNSKLHIRDFEYDEYSFERLDYQDIDFLLDYSDKEIKEIQYLDENRRYLHADYMVSGAPTKQKPFLDEKEVLLESGKRPVKFDMNSIGLFSVTSYIDTYIDTRFPTDAERKIVRRHVATIVGGEENKTSLKAKHNSEDRRTTITLPVLMRYVLALHMTKQEADDLLLFCGKVFSPVGKADRVYQNIIKLKEYDIHEVNGLCLKEKVDIIFSYDEAK